MKLFTYFKKRLCLNTDLDDIDEKLGSLLNDFIGILARTRETIAIAKENFKAAMAPRKIRLFLVEPTDED
jgi:hypothetical protein